MADSTPVECARSRETLKNSDLAGWAEYGNCASHSRFFWGLRLHLVCTLQGLPVGWALTGAKADEREALAQILDTTPALQSPRDRRQTVIADKGHFGRDFETNLSAARVDLLRPSRKGEKPRAGQRSFKPFRQVIESVNQTLKGQLDLEGHGGTHHRRSLHPHRPTCPGPHRRHWHNDNPDKPAKRSLIAYDH